MQATETTSKPSIDDEVFDRLKDEILNLIDGEDATTILGVLTCLIGEVGVNCGADLSAVLKATCMSIVHMYASQMPDEDSPIH